MMHKNDEENTIEELSTLLNHDEAILPEMIARLDAGVTRHVRSENHISVESRLAVLCLVFASVGMASPVNQFGPAAAGVLTVVGAVYEIGRASCRERV